MRLNGRAVRPGERPPVPPRLIGLAAGALVVLVLLVAPAVLKLDSGLVVRRQLVPTTLETSGSGGQPAEPLTDGSLEQQQSAVEGEPSVVASQDGASPYAEIARPAPTPTPGPLRPSVHVVTEGETLLEVADHFGLRPESVLWANDLPDPDLIVVGQKLVIPPTDGLIYKVDPGENLFGISLRYGLDLTEVAVANGLSDPDQLPEGLDLVLPGARPIAPSRVVADGPNAPPDAVAAPDHSGALAAAVLQSPLPSNVPQLLAAAWVKTAAPNALYAGPEPGARRYTALPAGVTLERTGDLAGRRIPVRDPGDGRQRQAMSGWIEVDDLEPARAPSPRALPRAYPADTRMDIFHTFVPYRGQLDGSPYSEANCGPTSVAMVLESFGIQASLARVRAQTLDAQQMWGNGTGTLITALASVVESYGLTTTGPRIDGAIHRWTLDEIREQLRARHPVIVQVRYRALPGREGAYFYGDHYIVVTGILDDGFLYNDPIDYDGPGWDRVISGDRLYRAMDATDRRYVYAGFAVSQ